MKEELIMICLILICCDCATNTKQLTNQSLAHTVQRCGWKYFILLDRLDFRNKGHSKLIFPSYQLSGK